MLSSKNRVRIGTVPIDCLTFSQAIDEIETLVTAKKGGMVFTPNVDHVVNSDSDPLFREAYANASLSLVDGTPLLWVSKLLGTPLPEKISGSDLFVPLIERAANRKWRVFLTGAGPGIAAKAAEELKKRFSVEIVGVDSPRISKLPGDNDESLAAVERVRAAQPDLLLVGFGSPKQELWIYKNAEALKPAVSVAIGAGIDFVAGTVPRAPRWVSDAGIEWLYRLVREPRRLWRRYLINDPKFLKILLSELPHRARMR